MLSQDEIDQLTRGTLEGDFSGSPDQKEFRVKIYPVVFKELEPSPNNKGADVEMKAFYDIPLDLEVELGSVPLKIGDLAELRIGDILKVERGEGEPVDIVIGGQLIAEGEVLVIGDKLGIRITTIVGSRRKR
jgi:flagellar motor switch protein FliN/FliY